MSYATAPLATIKADGRYTLAGGPFGSKLVSGDYEPTGVPVIRGVNLPDDSRFSWDDLVYVSESKVQRDLFGNLAFPGDVVVTQRGTLGQVGLIPSKCPYDRFVISQSQMKLTVDPSRADRQFVYYALRSPQGQHEIKSRAITTGVPHINLGTFQDVRIPVPPLATQRKIAAILSAYDDLIENNKRRIALMVRIAQDIYRQWFVEFRYPGREDAPLAESDLGRIPRGWELVPLGTVASVTKGLSYSGRYLTDTGRPMANLKCISPEGGFRRDGTKPYSGPCQAKHQVVPGNIVVANTDLTQAGNVIGAPALIPRRGFEGGGLISHHLFVIRPHDGVGTAFLFEALQDERFRAFARARSSGTTVLGLRTADCEAYPLLLPPSGLRQHYDEVARDALSAAERLEDCCEAAKAARDLLLPRLISGEIDVDDLDIAGAGAAA